MPTSVSTAMLIVAGLAFVAGLAALALSVLRVTLLGRSLRRLVAHLQELRRHPLVGQLHAENDPALRAVALEMNQLLADMRDRLQHSARRAADLEGLAAGPPDLALVGADADWIVTFFSRGAVMVLGWPAEDILGRHVEALLAPGEWERILPKLARRSLREAGLTETVRLQRRDGSVFPARLSVAGVAGNSASVLLAAHDLSAETETQDRLRDSEERHRLLVEGLGDGVFVLEGETLTYANPALGRMLGLDPAALKGAGPARLAHASEVLRLVDLLRRARSGQAPAGETRCLLATASGVPVEARLAWTTAEVRGRAVLIATVTDLRDTGRFERALAESEARLEATLESTVDGILVLEGPPSQRRATVVNRAFADLWSVDAEVLRRRPVDDVVRELRTRCADPAALESFLARGPEGAAAETLALELKDPRRAVELQAAPFAGGGAAGVVLSARDVTVRVDAERELRDSLATLSRVKNEIEDGHRTLAAAQRDLADRNEQLTSLNAELRSLDEMKSNLLANVSHELHTPLVSIKGYTEMILKRRLGPLTPEQERGLGVALKNIDRLIEMIDNLLSFSRIEKGETQLRLEDVPLWQIIDEAVELVGERVRRKSLSVLTEYATDELVVRGDRVKIGQVLINLLTNAVKFNRENGRITVTVRRAAGAFLEVDVADTGIGIPPEALDRIFERFYQADASRQRQYEGTGIGLSIVRDILRLHGGAIRVRSEVGQGSVFTFTLPLARDQHASARPVPRGREPDRG